VPAVPAIKPGRSHLQPEREDLDQPGAPVVVGLLLELATDHCEEGPVRAQSRSLSPSLRRSRSAASPYHGLLTRFPSPFRTRARSWTRTCSIQSICRSGVPLLTHSCDTSVPPLERCLCFRLAVNDIMYVAEHATSSSLGFRRDPTRTRRACRTRSSPEGGSGSGQERATTNRLSLSSRA
jgi:hypothetical protein